MSATPFKFPGKLGLCLVLFLCTLHLHSQQFGSSTSEPWSAQWISHPELEGDEFAVLFFKKEIELHEVPASLKVHLSADNRYKLYVNGTYITGGPARGDQEHWRYETLDLAPYLRTGLNSIAAEVWNFAEFRPVAQHSIRTGFILQEANGIVQQLNTNESWQVHKSNAYKPLPVALNAYYVVGPGEEFEGAAHPWGWKTKQAHNSDFVSATSLGPGRPLKSLNRYGNVPSHVLVSRNIPLMEEVSQRFQSIRRSTQTVDDAFISGEGAIQMEPNQQLTLLLDQGHLTNAYPILKFSGGKNARIQITYAESLFDGDGNKGNRNEIQGKTIRGNSDVILPDGGASRTFETLWWRTFRYVQLNIETGDDPLILEDFSSRFTGYPFEENALFKTSEELLDDIWEVSWWTQRLCSGENYFDCPYYEQLQYTGDTRIQCLISTYVSGDVALYKNALQSYYDSYSSVGITQSRYPSYDPQYIPTFSLIWITMLHDYWMLRDDEAFLEQMMPTALNILSWYEDRTNQEGLIVDPEWWMFVDWVDNQPGWQAGVPPGVDGKVSTVVNFQYVYTLQKAVELFRRFDLYQQADRFEARAASIQEELKKISWNAKRELFTDIPGEAFYSQHANILAILTETVTKVEGAQLLDRILEDTSIAPASFYFSFYLMEALRKTGQENRYLELLGPWEQMLENGLTTFAEKPEPTRSDCHAWSASPMYFFLSMVCGIQPGEKGFRTVKISPHLGHLKSVKGEVPHPQGTIKVAYQVVGNILSAEIVLPSGLTGVLEWKGETHKIDSGINRLSIPF